jgi:hypothetical protein
MKTIEIDRYSWFNRKLDKFHVDINWETLDFCGYIQKVAVFVGITGLMVGLISFAMLALGVNMLSNVKFFANMSLWIALPICFLVGAVAISAIAGTITGIFVGLYTLNEKYRAWRKRRKLAKAEKEPSFVKLSYLALRQKMCVKIVLKR